MKVAWYVNWGMIKKKHKVMIIISLRVWIVRIFIIKVYGILTVNVLIKINLIVLGMCDFNVSMNWLFFGGVSIYCLVKIVMFWKLEIFRIKYV